MLQKNKNSKIEKKAAKATGKFLMDISDIFSGITCSGNWHEPKMPKSLKK